MHCRLSNFVHDNKRVPFIKDDFFKAVHENDETIKQIYDNYICKQKKLTEIAIPLYIHWKNQILSAKYAMHDEVF